MFQLMGHIAETDSEIAGFQIPPSFAAYRVCRQRMARRRQRLREPAIAQPLEGLVDEADPIGIP